MGLIGLCIGWWGDILDFSTENVFKAQFRANPSRGLPYIRYQKLNQIRKTTFGALFTSSHPFPSHRGGYIRLWRVILRLGTCARVKGTFRGIAFAKSHSLTSQTFPILLRKDSKSKLGIFFWAPSGTDSQEYQIPHLQGSSHIIGKVYIVYEVWEIIKAKGRGCLLWQPLPVCLVSGCQYAWVDRRRKYKSITVCGSD